MKTFIDFSNTDKARLLHELFPTEIPIFLEHLDKVCLDFAACKEEYTKQWGNDFIPFGYWLSLSVETTGLLKRHKLAWQKVARCFSDQLFYTSIFVNDCIVNYAVHISENEKFKIAVDLLINHKR